MPTSSSGPRFSAHSRLRALQADIMELILERDLHAGDPLPTESELSLALGVGRNTLRECLKVLQALGVVEIRHGFGMLVAPSNFHALADGLTFRGRLSLRHDGSEALQLVDVRQALESGLIGAVMDLTTKEHLRRIEGTVARMETTAGDGELIAEIDAEFHRLLFAPLDNELLSNLMAVFWNVYRKIHAEVGMDIGNLIETAAMHREIFESVKGGDKELASEQLKRHFDGIRPAIHHLIGASLRP